MNQENKPRILVADDDPHILGLLSDSLKQDFQVVTVHSGAEVMSSLHRARPDLIVLDVMMPGMDGFEICARLKGMRQFNSIPIIMLTAMSEHEDMVCGVKSGANEYFTKPFEVNALIAAVRMQLERAERIKTRQWIEGWTEFTIKNNLEYLEELNNLIEQLYSQENIDDETILELTIAFRELLDNAFEHGNRKDPDKKIFVSYLLLNDRLLIKIEDLGAGFDPDQVPNPLAEENFFKSRGRGIHIVRELMDEVTFSADRQPLDEDLKHLVPPEEHSRQGQIALMVKYLK